jgi:hypothetical protein
LIIAAVVAGLVVVVAFIGLVFLGGQVAKILSGTMEFGTSGTECSVTGPAATFPTSTKIHLVAHLTREVLAGGTVTEYVTLPDGTNQTKDTVVTTTGTCLFTDLNAGLSPGHYVLEMRSGGEVLSKGAFDITP